MDELYQLEMNPATDWHFLHIQSSLRLLAYTNVGYCVL